MTLFLGPPTILLDAQSPSFTRFFTTVSSTKDATLPRSHTNLSIASDSRNPSSPAASCSDLSLTNARQDAVSQSDMRVLRQADADAAAATIQKAWNDWKARRAVTYAATVSSSSAMTSLAAPTTSTASTIGSASPSSMATTSFGTLNVIWIGTQQAWDAWKTHLASTYTSTLASSVVKMSLASVGLSSTFTCTSKPLSLSSIVPINLGGFCDLYVGYHGVHGTVALKRPRLKYSAGLVDIRRFCLVAAPWSQLSHPNLLLFLGTCTIGLDIYLVSPFVEKGNLLCAIKDGMNLDLNEILYETASATAYLHRMGIVHGNIKAANILISASGSALLSDFGLVKAFDSMMGAKMAIRRGDSIRWMAPELFVGGGKSVESDVYAFGMTIVEVLTGEHPFAQASTIIDVVIAVIAGHRPAVVQPEGQDERVFRRLLGTAEKCWPSERQNRPSMAQVMAMLAPRVNDLSESVSLLDVNPVAMGGFCDLYMGHDIIHGKVALKQPRFAYELSDLRRFHREISVWCKLLHPNLLPFLGTCTIDHTTYMVSPFVARGDLYSCIRNGIEIRRTKILRELADAISYLHDEGIIHGDIKAQNVLISDRGSTLLCDFGLAKVFQSMVTSTEMKGRGSTRWMAPELFMGESKTMASDVYAFGITIAEVLSGAIPLSNIPRESEVIKAILNEERPVTHPFTGPNGVSYHTHWRTAKCCWVSNAQHRPSMALVVKLLDGVITSVPGVDIKSSQYPVSRYVAPLGLLLGDWPFELTSPMLVDWLRLYPDLYPQARKWSKISHSNILSFLGMCNFSPIGLTILPPQTKGDLLSNLRTRRGRNLDRTEIAYQIADAVAHLHKAGIVHGDLKAQNVLLSLDDTILLCDFDVAKTFQPKLPSVEVTDRKSTRWKAPELFGKGDNSKESDVYAFSMIIVELITGDIPFARLPLDNMVKYEVTHGGRPRQEPLTSRDGKSYGRLWEVASRCWADAPKSRPPMSQVVKNLVLRINDISGLVTLLGKSPIGFGGCCDLFLGHHLVHGKVALKRLRFTSSVGFDAQRFYTEAGLWGNISHPNILPFFGTCLINGSEYMVSSFITKGDLLSYIQSGRSLVRDKMIYQIADAVAYLHRLNIVHGDIKAQNVLISDENTALLCDFGLADAFDSSNDRAEVFGRGSTRWMAPELFKLKKAKRTKECDVYAFGMTIAEVLTGEPPFAHLAFNDAVAFEVVEKNTRPRRPSKESSEGKLHRKFWDTAEKCWVTDSQLRPPMEFVSVMLLSNTNLNAWTAWETRCNPLPKDKNDAS